MTSILEFISKVGEIASKEAARRWEGQQVENNLSDFNPALTKLVEELRQRRKMQGMTRQELSEKTGIDYTVLVLLENGILIPEKVSQSDIDKIAKVLENETIPPSKNTSESRQQQRVFELSPLVGKLSEFISGSKVAYASGTTTTEADTYLIHQPDHFTFELLNKKYEPHTIYLKIRELSPELEGHKCIVTVKTAEKKWQSMPTELRVNGQVEIGKDPHFHRKQVETINVEIE